MKATYFIFIIFFSVGCKKEKFTIENLNGNKIGIIGHGGCGFYGMSNPYAANSYSSITRGINGYYAEGAEMDLQMSSDNVIFLFHDPVLEISTNYAGCLYQFDSASLSICEFRNNYSFESEYLIPLEKILALYQSYSPKPFLFLDVRTSVDCSNLVSSQDEYEDTMAKKINTLIMRYNYMDCIFVEAHGWGFLNKMNLLNPSLKLIYDGKIDPATIENAIAGNLYGLISNTDETTKEDVGLAHQSNLRVVLFDVKSAQSQFATVRKNPDFIQTDRVLLLQRVLN